MSRRYGSRWTSDTAEARIEVKTPAVSSRRKREEIGTYSVMPSVEGWTLQELAVLHRYRRRTT